MFKPKYVYIEKDALDYSLGKKIHEYFKNTNSEIILLKGNRVTGLPTDSMQNRHQHGKNSLVVAVRKSLKFQTCKPSAHYQLPLVTGCMGNCEYCYLQTRFSKSPFTKLYVNIPEILAKAEDYIKEREDITIFEGAAVSDPVPVEPYTGALAKSIEFFANNKKARFTFVTKYNSVDSLLKLNHNNHTTIRFSLNIDSVIKKFEHRTPNLRLRLEAAHKIAKSGYALGFIIAPVMLEGNWQDDYLGLLNNINNQFKNIKKPIVIEVISHRFTAKAKETILSLHPNSELPMSEEDRKFKFGQFGYGKYIYPKEKMQEMKQFFENHIKNMGDKWRIKYII
ncbi:spore photoproduct lyase [Clostridium sp. 'deep sea']|uniref:spore photoproduct lyase n=1 Tax=Clostridium sp. 'deep sea' TaxID=2779445 RepID=UPI00189699D4|nr:spore photoproduct lyase [Clostridium sp. 'deep sea']QOR36256.1 spore photoproduct lyase [Clostridium sp. 'deep sea']